MAIDPTARVADGARIGEGVEIGPYCLVGPQVELFSGVRLIAHVNVTGVTTIGGGLGAKRLGLLHDLVPRAAQLALLVDPRTPSAKLMTAETQAQPTEAQPVNNGHTDP